MHYILDVCTHSLGHYTLSLHLSPHSVTVLQLSGQPTLLGSPTMTPIIHRLHCRILDTHLICVTQPHYTCKRTM